jgi:hypothetical protein
MKAWQSHPVLLVAVERDDVASYMPKKQSERIKISVFSSISHGPMDDPSNTAIAQQPKPRFRVSWSQPEEAISPEDSLK